MRILSAARLRRAHFDDFEDFGLDFASRVRIAPGSRLGLGAGQIGDFSLYTL